MLGVGTAGPIGEATSTGSVDEPSRRLTAPPAPAQGALPLTERESWAVLTSVSGLGPVGFGALLRAFGTGREILGVAVRADGPRLLVAAGVTDERQPFGLEVATRIGVVARDPGPVLERIRSAGVGILTLDDEAFPARLRQIEMPPHVLFVAGDVAALSLPRAVAVVGTRRATEGGRLTAARIGAAIARCGAAVVSGLAVGIDGSAQAAVTAENGITVAVLGSGHGRLYPRAHALLAQSIVRTGGAIVSELPPDAKPTGGTFPRRNRLISGLSDATVVVEAGEQSGALITAGWALEQGRDCFIVPGAIDAPRSAGCLRWLRDYASQVRIVAGIPELIEDLELLDSVGPRPALGAVSLDAELIELGKTARTIAVQLVRGRGTIDELVASTGHPVATTLGALTLLEVRGLATSAYGRYRPTGRLAAADAHPRRARDPSGPDG
jgi:DNA processing protein